MKIKKTITAILIFILAFWLYEESDLYLFEYSKRNISYEKLMKTPKPIPYLIPFENLPNNTTFNVTYLTGRDFSLVISFSLSKDKLDKFMRKISTEWGNENDNHWFMIPTTKYDSEISQNSKFYVFPKTRGGAHWYVFPFEGKVIYHVYTT